MKGLDLITGAMRLIGVLAAEESPTSSEVADGLLALNDMIEAWSAERMMIFTITILDFPLTPGKQNYTYGLGGDFNAPRPVNIDHMGIITFNNPAQPLELPLDMLSDQGWQDIPVKGISSTFPQKCYDDGAFPLRNLGFWCIPSAPCSVRVYSWTALTQFTDLTTDITFPAGYAKALRYNLALELAPEYNKEPSSLVLAQAIDSKARIKSINAPVMEMKCDPAVVGDGGKPIYNWLTDGPASRS